VAAHRSRRGGRCRTGPESAPAGASREGASRLAVALCRRLVEVLRRAGRGQGLTEYALIIGVIALFVFGVVLTLGQRVDALFSTVATCLQNFPGC